MTNPENEDKLFAKAWLTGKGCRKFCRPKFDPPDYIVCNKFAVEVSRLIRVNADLNSSTIDLASLSIVRCTARTGSLKSTDSSDLSLGTAASNSTTARTLLLRRERKSMLVFWGIARKLANSLPNGLRHRLFDSLHCGK